MHPCRARAHRRAGRTANVRSATDPAPPPAPTPATAATPRRPNARRRADRPASVVLQPNARSVNVTSATPVAMAAHVERYRGGLRPEQHLPLRESARCSASAVMPAEQWSGVARRTGDAAIYRCRPRARVHRLQQILNGAQSWQSTRDQQQRQHQQHELRDHQRCKQRDHVHRAGTIVVEGGKRHPAAE